MGGLTEGCQEGTRNISHWHYICLILMCTQESLKHDKVLSSLIRAFCTLYCQVVPTLADSELILMTIQPAEEYDNS